MTTHGNAKTGAPSRRARLLEDQAANPPDNQPEDVDATLVDATSENSVDMQDVPAHLGSGSSQNVQETGGI